MPLINYIFPSKGRHAFNFLFRNLKLMNILCLMLKVLTASTGSFWGHISWFAKTLDSLDTTISCFLWNSSRIITELSHSYKMSKEKLCKKKKNQRHIKRHVIYWQPTAFGEINVLIGFCHSCVCKLHFRNIVINLVQ